jgi:predicted secreted acid phosphatase
MCHSEKGQPAFGSVLDRPLILLFSVLLLAAGCQQAPAKPRNLADVKKDLRAYAKGDYLVAVKKVAADVEKWIVGRSAQKQPDEKLLVVFDLDETLLNNQGYFDLVDYGYTSQTWTDWNLKGKAEAIEPVKQLFLDLRKRGIAIALITGRREKTRSGAVANMTFVGCEGYQFLIMRPDDDRGSVIPFKTGERRRLAQQGYAIIANVGDQESDLAGGYSERVFRLPNPFYFVP